MAEENQAVATENQQPPSEQQGPEPNSVQEFSSDVDELYDMIHGYKSGITPEDHQSISELLNTYQKELEDVVAADGESNEIAILRDKLTDMRAVFGSLEVKPNTEKPNLNELQYDELIAKLREIKGIGEKRSEWFADGIEAFKPIESEADLRQIAHLGPIFSKKIAGKFNLVQIESVEPADTPEYEAHDDQFFADMGEGSEQAVENQVLDVGEEETSVRPGSRAQALLSRLRGGTANNGQVVLTQVDGQTEKPETDADQPAENTDSQAAEAQSQIQEDDGDTKADLERLEKIGLDEADRLKRNALKEIQDQLKRLSDGQRGLLGGVVAGGAGLAIGLLLAKSGHAMEGRYVVQLSSMAVAVPALAAHEVNILAKMANSQREAISSMGKGLLKTFDFISQSHIMYPFVGGVTAGMFADRAMSAADTAMYPQSPEEVAPPALATDMTTDVGDMGVESGHVSPMTIDHGVQAEPVQATSMATKMMESGQVPEMTMGEGPLDGQHESVTANFSVDTAIDAPSPGIDTDTSGIQTQFSLTENEQPVSSASDADLAATRAEVGGQVQQEAQGFFGKLGNMFSSMFGREPAPTASQTVSMDATAAPMESVAQTAPSVDRAPITDMPPVGGNTNTIESVPSPAMMRTEPGVRDNPPLEFDMATPTEVETPAMTRTGPSVGIEVNEPVGLANLAPQMTEVSDLGPSTANISIDSGESDDSVAAITEPGMTENPVSAGMQSTVPGKVSEFHAPAPPAESTANMSTEQPFAVSEAGGPMTSASEVAPNMSANPFQESGVAGPMTGVGEVAESQPGFTPANMSVTEAPEVTKFSPQSEVGENAANMSANPASQFEMNGYVGKMTPATPVDTDVQPNQTMVNMSSIEEPRQVTDFVPAPPVDSSAAGDEVMSTLPPKPVEFETLETDAIPGASGVGGDISIPEGAAVDSATTGRVPDEVARRSPIEDNPPVEPAKFTSYVSDVASGVTPIESVDAATAPPPPPDDGGDDGENAMEVPVVPMMGAPIDSPPTPEPELPNPPIGGPDMSPDNDGRVVPATDALNVPRPPIEEQGPHIAPPHENMESNGGEWDMTVEAGSNVWDTMQDSPELQESLGYAPSNDQTVAMQSLAKGLNSTDSNLNLVHPGDKLSDIFKEIDAKAVLNGGVDISEIRNNPTDDGHIQFISRGAAEELARLVEAVDPDRYGDHGKLMAEEYEGMSDSLRNAIQQLRVGRDRLSDEQMLEVLKAIYKQ